MVSLYTCNHCIYFKSTYSGFAGFKPTFLLVLANGHSTCTRVIALYAARFCTIKHLLMHSFTTFSISCQCAHHSIRVKDLLECLRAVSGNSGKFQFLERATVADQPWLGYSRPVGSRRPGSAFRRCRVGNWVGMERHFAGVAATGARNISVLNIKHAPAGPIHGKKEAPAVHRGQ